MAMPPPQAPSKAEIGAKVVAPDIRISDDLIGRAFGQDMALMDDERPVDELERFADVVIRNKHPDSPSGELSHQVANITDRNRVNSGEGLVEEHEFGVCGEGTRDFHAATFAARERNSRRMPEVGD
jgi:hypothetical protein